MFLVVKGLTFGIWIKIVGKRHQQIQDATLVVEYVTDVLFISYKFVKGFLAITFLSLVISS